MGRDQAFLLNARTAEPSLAPAQGRGDGRTAGLDAARPTPYSALSYKHRHVPQNTLLFPTVDPRAAHSGFPARTRSRAPGFSVPGLCSKRSKRASVATNRVA
jgi:hypothetical protein